MLRIIQSDSAAGAKSYYNDGLSKEDYYADGHEIAGVWGGKAAERLGLVGQVEKSAFDALCDNRYPAKGNNLTPRTRQNRRVGYDINFHAPKSVSIQYALTGDRRIMDAFRDAVRETMQEIERDARCRIRKGGQRGERETGNLVWAEFIHLTARPVGGVPDPHLHAHAFTFNATWDDAETTWKAGEFGAIKRDAPYFEAAFHARLAGALVREGFAVERHAKGWELAGVSREMIDKYSRRTALIEKTAARRGIESDRAKDRLGASTREKKTNGLSTAALKAEWQGRLTAGERAALGAVGKEFRSASRMSSKEAVDHAMGHVFERASVVPERRLMEAALRRGVGSVTVEGVRDLVHRTDMIRGERDGVRLATTRDVLREEEELISMARAGRGTCRSLAGEWTPKGNALNQEQRNAVAHLLSSPDRIMAVSGGAGVGKTTLMREAVSAIEAAGRRVFAFAPSAEASRGLLRQEGFQNAETVARLLVDRELQGQVRGQVIWIDEAGLLGVRAMKDVFAIAKEQGARVILTGDTRQHTAVERGDALRLLEDSGAVRPVDVRRVQRQKGGYRDAVEALGRGDLADGINRLDVLGAIVEAPQEQRYDRLAEDYARTVKAGKTVLAVSPTHREGEAVTAKIRGRLQKIGVVHGEEREFVRHRNLGWTEAQRSDVAGYTPGQVVRFHQNVKGFKKGARVEVAGLEDGKVLVSDGTGKRVPLPLAEASKFQVYEPARLPLAVGDKVRITENGMTMEGSRVFNGATYDVAGFTEEGGIALSNGRTLAADFGGLAHGYCVTSHASQGKTVDRVLIAQSADSWRASSREQFYVSVSRGRQGVTIYTDDREGLRRAVGESSARPSAIALAHEAEKPRSSWRDHPLGIARMAYQARAYASRKVTQLIEKYATFARTGRHERGFEYERERE